MCYYTLPSLVSICRECSLSSQKISRLQTVSLTSCYIVDFETLTKDSVGEHFQDGDVFFNTMGTTRKVAGSAVCNTLCIKFCAQIVGKKFC